MSNIPIKNSSIVEQAAYWATCLDDGDLNAHERDELARWLNKSPEHVKELLLAQAILVDAAYIDAEKQISIETLLEQPEDNIVDIHTATKTKKNESNHAKPTFWRHFNTPARAVMALCACLIIAILSMSIMPSPSGKDKGLYTTDIGEQRSFSLSDGSVIHLNTQSEVRVQYEKNERAIYLLKGEAMFTVAHNINRPFRVHAGPTVAQALGTSFNVYLKDRDTEVAVLEGTVAVSNDPENTESDTKTSQQTTPLATLTKGQKASVTSDGTVVTTMVADVQKIAFWRQRKLVFEDAPVSEIISEFNRYNEIQIIIENIGLQEPQFSGVFDVNNPNAFIKTLEVSGANVRRPAGQKRVIINFAAFNSNGTARRNI
ncbi:FecR family protein [Kordiimonas pumila]|uniref:FecR family protein n=1 Tax=Kordiimonas pumila TaxID=2161677 RepID=A0ABV7D1P0_9PROT|nr:FecR domain-containing protein [Kordiimonas pumila]